jgi:molecular chaperone HtpG
LKQIYCKKILSMEDEAGRNLQVRSLADLALLSQGLLKGADLTAFIERSMTMLAPGK